MRRSDPTRVTLSNVTKAFHRKDEPTIEVDSLVIEPGEFLTLVGPSGCGKTTTMRMIAGLEDPTSGAIFFGDRVVNDVPVQHRNVAMVFQNYALYPHMRVVDNLQYGLRKRGMAAAERAEKVEWVSKLLRIETLLDRKPRHISGGEQQRVALGRAIIRNPNVLLLDEPLSNLDARLRMTMRGELVKLQRQIGCTTVFVTHDQLEAMTMSDRIAVMNKGRIQQLGSPEQIYNAPASLFVAGFIGSPPMNMLEGRAVEAGGRYRFVGAEVEIEIGATTPRAWPPDGLVTLGVRPEHVTLHADAGDVRAQVQLVEFVGAEKLVFLQSASGQIIARASAQLDVAPGDRLNCRFEHSKLGFFSSTTGQRLEAAPARPALV